MQSKNTKIKSFLKDMENVDCYYKKMPNEFCQNYLVKSAEKNDSKHKIYPDAGKEKNSIVKQSDPTNRFVKIKICNQTLQSNKNSESNIFTKDNGNIEHRSDSKGNLGTNLAVKPETINNFRVDRRYESTKVKNSAVLKFDTINKFSNIQNFNQEMQWKSDIIPKQYMNNMKNTNSALIVKVSPNFSSKPTKMGILHENPKQECLYDAKYVTGPNRGKCNQISNSLEEMSSHSRSCYYTDDCITPVCQSNFENTGVQELSQMKYCESGRYVSEHRKQVNNIKTMQRSARMSFNRMNTMLRNQTLHFCTEKASDGICSKNPLRICCQMDGNKTVVKEQTTQSVSKDNQRNFREIVSPSHRNSLFSKPNSTHRSNMMNNSSNTVNDISTYNQMSPFTNSLHLKTIVESDCLPSEVIYYPKSHQDQRIGRFPQISVIQPLSSENSCKRLQDFEINSEYLCNEKRLIEKATFLPMMPVSPNNHFPIVKNKKPCCNQINMMLNNRGVPVGTQGLKRSRKNLQTRLRKILPKPVNFHVSSSPRFPERVKIKSQNKSVQHHPCNQKRKASSSADFKSERKKKILAEQCLYEKIKSGMEIGTINKSLKQSFSSVEKNKMELNLRGIKRRHYNVECMDKTENRCDSATSFQKRPSFRQFKFPNRQNISVQDKSFPQIPQLRKFPPNFRSEREIASKYILSKQQNLGNETSTKDKCQKQCCSSEMTVSTEMKRNKILNFLGSEGKKNKTENLFKQNIVGNLRNKPCYHPQKIISVQTKCCEKFQSNNLTSNRRSTQKEVFSCREKDNYLNSCTRSLYDRQTSQITYFRSLSDDDEVKIILVKKSHESNLYDKNTENLSKDEGNKKLCLSSSGVNEDIPKSKNVEKVVCSLNVLPNSAKEESKSHMFHKEEKHNLISEAPTRKIQDANICVQKSSNGSDQRKESFFSIVNEEKICKDECRCYSKHGFCRITHARSAVEDELMEENQRCPFEDGINVYNTAKNTGSKSELMNSIKTVIKNKPKQSRDKRATKGNKKRISRSKNTLLKTMKSNGKKLRENPRHKTLNPRNEMFGDFLQVINVLKGTSKQSNTSIDKWVADLQQQVIEMKKIRLKFWLNFRFPKNIKRNDWRKTVEEIAFDTLLKHVSEKMDVTGMK